MKKNILKLKSILVLVNCLIISHFSFSQSDIIISQYIETSSGTTPKGIEIFNISGASITFSAGNTLQVYQGTNGGACSSLVTITSGTLATDEVWVIGTTDLITYASLNGTDLSGTTTQAFSFNGDDALQIYLGGVLQDEFGTCGVDPGASWSGSGVSTANQNIQVKDGLCDGDTTGWTDPSIRFDQIANGLTMTGFGNAPAACSAGCSHTVSGFSPSSGAVGDSVTISGTGFTGSSTVAFNGTSASTTFVNSTTLTATVPIGATTGVITVTESGCDVDSASSFTVTACTPTQTISGFAPTSGPELTEVTITGTGFTGSSTVDFNGTSATIVSQTSTQIIAEVPAGATTGVITVTESGCPLDSSTDFTVETDNGCTGSAPIGFTDLLFSGIYDETSGSCHYIELYNPTSSAIDLSAYSIGSSNNQADATSLPGTYNGGTYALSGTIQPNSTFLILATSSSTNCASCTNVTLDLELLSSALGYNGYTALDYDKLILLNGATPIDLWSNGDGHDAGYIYSRLTTATAPATTFNSADWSSNTTPDCFSFAISSAPKPTINSDPVDHTGCSTVSFSVSATAANAGTLTYQWRYNDGSASGWTDLTSSSFSPATVTGETSTTVSISGANLDGYQFYCAVFEDGTCASYSDAAQINTTTTTWNGTSWNNGTPDINTFVVIDGDYLTGTDGNFSACQLFINAGYRLTVDDLTYVEVENNVSVDGELWVETQGAFVQNNDASNFTVGGSGSAQVNKLTSTLNNWYDYTYWSSPVANATVGTALAIAPANRRYWFNAANYLDVLMESGNDNTLIAGHDDIDDNGDDWKLALSGDIMSPGVGYAATVSQTGFFSGASYLVTFQGAFNNGVITTPIAYNGPNGDLDWNFIGNPYPCALDAVTFLNDNAAVISGSAYLWSQNTQPSAGANGNQESNFAQADYAIITASGVNTAGGDGIIPNDYIPSGQGFFVQGLANGNVTFNNAMRMADITSNSQFFKTPNKQKKSQVEPNAVWIDLDSDNGLYSQIALAYLDGATNGNDGMGYDAIRNMSSGVSAALYSKMEGESNKFAIQCKASSSLINNEVISIGFISKMSTETNYTLSIARLKGALTTSFDVYINDSLLGIEHNLTQSDYNFTSLVGEFNDRFQVVLKENNSLSTDFDNAKSNELVISKNKFGNLELATTNQSIIDNIEILDILGRTIYNKTVNEKKALLNLNLPDNRSVLITKVTLENGSKLSKTIILK